MGGLKQFSGRPCTATSQSTSDDDPSIYRDILLRNHIPNKKRIHLLTICKKFFHDAFLPTGTFRRGFRPSILVCVSNSATPKNVHDLQGRDPSITIWLSESRREGQSSQQDGRTTGGWKGPLISGITPQNIACIQPSCNIGSAKHTGEKDKAVSASARPGP